MSKEQTKPSDSLVQQLLNERRELKITVERLKLDLADAQAAGGVSPSQSKEVGDLRTEVERLRYQLASVRAEATQLREERDDLRDGIEKVLSQIADSEE